MKIKVMKYDDIKNGLTILEYLDWAKKFEPLQLFNASCYANDKEISKNDILDYAHWNYVTNKKSSKPYTPEYSNLKCKTCNNCYKINVDNTHNCYIVQCKEDNLILPHECKFGDDRPNLCHGYKKI